MRYQMRKTMPSQLKSDDDGVRPLKSINIQSHPSNELRSKIVKHLEPPEIININPESECYVHTLDHDVRYSHLFVWDGFPIAGIIDRHLIFPGGSYSEDVDFLKKYILPVIAKFGWDDAIPCPENLMMGSDPEFETIVNGKQHPIKTTMMFADFGEFGRDGSSYHQVEIRPTPSELSPKGAKEMMNKINKILSLMSMNCPLGRVSVKGDHVPIGFHIHFGGTPKAEYHPTLFNILNSLATHLTPLNGKARGRYCELYSDNAYRSQPWGWEYRPLPSGLLYNEELAYLVLSTIATIAAKFYKGVEFDENLKGDALWMQFFGGEANGIKGRIDYLVEQGGKDNSLTYYGMKFIVSLPSGFLVNQQDDWNINTINKVCAGLSKRKMKNIYFYGLKKERGNIFSWEMDTPPGGDISDNGKMRVGLPWEFRMMEFNPTMIDVVASGIELIKMRETPNDEVNKKEGD